MYSHECFTNFTNAHYAIVFTHSPLFLFNFTQIVRKSTIRVHSIVLARYSGSLTYCCCSTLAPNRHISTHFCSFLFPTTQRSFLFYFQISSTNSNLTLSSHYTHTFNFLQPLTPFSIITTTLTTPTTSISNHFYN